MTPMSDDEDFERDIPNTILNQYKLCSSNNKSTSKNLNRNGLFTPVKENIGEESKMFSAFYDK